METTAVDGGVDSWQSAEARALRRSLSEAQTKLSAKEAELVRCQDRLAVARRESTESHHRIANNLHLVIGFLRLQERSALDTPMKVAMFGAIARVEAIARLHRQFSKEPSAATLNFGTYLNALAEDLSASLALRCSVSTEPIDLEERLAVNLAVAINELAINAAKYGCDADGISRIEITCCRDDRRNLRITVKDRGRGISDGQQKNKRASLGLSLVRAVLTQHGGELIIENDAGARMILLIPHS